MYLKDSNFFKLGAAGSSLSILNTVWNSYFALVDNFKAFGEEGSALCSKMPPQHLFLLVLKIHLVAFLTIAPSSTSHEIFQQVILFGLPQYSCIEKLDFDWNTINSKMIMKNVATTMRRTTPITNRYFNQLSYFRKMITCFIWLRNSQSLTLFWVSQRLAVTGNPMIVPFKESQKSTCSLVKILNC